MKRIHRQGLLLARATNGRMWGLGSTATPKLFSTKAAPGVSDSMINHVGGKSWVPSSDKELQRITTQALVHEISRQKMQQIEDFVPWFLSNMPASYFRQVSEQLRLMHISSLCGAGNLNAISMKVDTKNDVDGSIDSTLISSQPKLGLLNDQINSLAAPPDTSLTKVKVFSSIDGQIALNIFTFEARVRSSAEVGATKEDAEKIFAYLEKVKLGTVPPLNKGVRRIEYQENLHSESTMLEYLSLCKPSYAKNSDPRRFLAQREMFADIRGTDRTAVYLEPSPDLQLGGAWITIACANVLPQLMLKLSSELLRARGLDITRAHLDIVSDPANSTPELPGFVTMLRLLIRPHDLLSTASEANKQAQQALLSDLRRSKWIDDEVRNYGLARHPSLGLEKAEVIAAICSFLHGPLAKFNASAFSSVATILDLISTSPHFVSLADNIASLFLDRFNPAQPLSEAAFSEREEDIRKRIQRLQFEQARVLLQKMLDAVRFTQKTNFYHPERYALGMRFDPRCMAGIGGIGIEKNKPLPFGILFVYGRDFCAFHNRFRDIARGGLRVVTPPNSAQHALESSRAYDEAYGLSYAQQLKNKDIPEGGSKAVVLVKQQQDAHTKFAVVRKSIRAFTDSVLDLTVKQSCAELVDLYRKEELIYLGPDEQVIPSDIDWITIRAAQRNYPIPSAFMSSKQGAGFNHKQYGVTSEGVVVYLETALKATLGLDPRKQPFTVKITGGPDGDVAGNLIKILFREFPSTCSILAVSDGTGVCEDPQGLDAEELLRLVAASAPIVNFNPSKLGKQGVCLSIETDEGLSRRNSMVFRIKADAFVPAGGRPNTINVDNWRQFLDDKGVPTSPLIVEGANLFITPEARESLFSQAQVAIVKDSSANKCGVITSSCEVAASMLLSTEEFLSHKDALVNDVLVRLRHLARLEAELLFREYKNYPGALPHFSERISNAINVATDALTERLSTVSPGDDLWSELLPLVKENLPQKLQEVAWQVGYSYLSYRHPPYLRILPNSLLYFSIPLYLTSSSARHRRQVPHPVHPQCHGVYTCE